MSDFLFRYNRSLIGLTRPDLRQQLTAQHIIDQSGKVGEFARWYANVEYFHVAQVNLAEDFGGDVFAEARL